MKFDTRKVIESYPYRSSKTFYALPYNPYGELKENYKWGVTKMFFDLENEVLIGREFWDFIGGKDTYKQSLEIFESIGRREGKEMMARLIRGL